MKRNILLAAAFFFAIYTAHSQYHINLSIPRLAGDTLVFGHYFNESIMLQDTFFLNSSGKAEIKSDKSLPPGLYAIFFPGQKRFDLIIDKDQNFSITSDTIDLVNHTEISGSEDNKVFYSYLAYLENKRKEADQLQKRMANPQNSQDSITARADFMKINDLVKRHIETTIEKNKDLFVSKFILSLKEPQVPELPRDAQGNVTDSTYQIRYYKNHYWDYFDLADVRMLRTPFYEKKLNNYLDRWIYPEPDSVYKEVDMLIEKSRSDTLLFKYMLTTLFNYYAKSKYIGMDAVYAYIAQEYFIPEATWSDPEFIKKLEERVEKINPLVIGKVGPDIKLVRLSDDHFKAAMEDTAVKRNPYAGSFFNLSGEKGEYTILYFWEADCGHCKKTIPILHNFFNKMKDKGVKVIAVNMLGGIEGKVAWVDFVNEYKLYGWINAWNPYDFSYRDAYDVSSSNTLFLLDKNMKILAKKISPEQVEAIIENEMKKKKQ